MHAFSVTPNMQITRTRIHPVIKAKRNEGKTHLGDGKFRHPHTVQ
jgi:hypothetical protein